MLKNDIIFEKRTDTEYTFINWSHMYRIHCARKDAGINDQFSGPGTITRTYDKIPKHKIFDFLRNAFETCEWNKVKKFKLRKNPAHEYHIDGIYFDYELSGYNLKMLYHYHLENGNKSHGIACIKDINSLEPIDYCLSLNDVIIIE